MAQVMRNQGVKTDGTVSMNLIIMRYIIRIFYHLLACTDDEVIPVIVEFNWFDIHLILSNLRIGMLIAKGGSGLGVVFS